MVGKSRFEVPAGITICCRFCVPQLRSFSACLHSTPCRKKDQPQIPNAAVFLGNASILAVNVYQDCTKTSSPDQVTVATLRSFTPPTIEQCGQVPGICDYVSALA